MNILFLSLIDFNSIEERGIYQDLLREFIKQEHKLYIISPEERKKTKRTRLIVSEKATILKLKIGNIQKTNIIEKGISTILLEPIFVHGIKRYFSDVKFDLVLYSTPPITFCKAVKYIKKRDGAISYLMLKDIFPQNSVDLGMLKKTGIKGIIYKYFRYKEKHLYESSDFIGCMSNANVEYVLKHNKEIDKMKVGMCPNSIEYTKRTFTYEEKMNIRKKYDLPQAEKIFVYGGNLGRPQGIEHIIECLKAQRNNKQIHFFIVGSGTEYKKIEEFIKVEQQENVTLRKEMKKEDYDLMLYSCDVGMIFLDYRFTIPNFPSRLLTYMQAGIPVMAITDKNTDIGCEIVNGNFGWWCESDSVDKFNDTIEMILNEKSLEEKGKNAIKCLDNYSVSKTYSLIMNQIKNM